jgi:hypothetical protein
MLAFQNQSSDLTLAQGISEYREYLKIKQYKIMNDGPNSRMILEHDAIHVIFGLDASIEQEILNDTWVLLACNWHWSYIKGYFQLDDIKELQIRLFKEIGLIRLMLLYVRLLPKVFKIFRRARKMKNKWLYRFDEKYLQLPISFIRNDYGIEILNYEDIKIKNPLKWSGAKS